MPVRKINLTDDHRHDPFYRVVKALHSVADDLLKITPAALDAQWSRSRTIARVPLDPEAARDAGAIRGKGDTSDPVGEVAIDHKRQRLQKELRTAEAHAKKAYAYLAGAQAALDRALAEWEGERRG